MLKLKKKRLTLCLLEKKLQDFVYFTTKYTNIFLFIF